MFIIINMVFVFANVNASICAILFSHACVLFILVAFCDEKNNLLYLNVIFLHNCTYLTFDLTLTLNQNINLGIHPYIFCNSPSNNSSLDAEH